MPNALPRLPRYIWADYDPSYRGANRWSFYTSRSEQQGNRPDLVPIRFRVTTAVVIAKKTRKR